jgi:hypothetical protein
MISAVYPWLQIADDIAWRRWSILSETGMMKLISIIEEYAIKIDPVE